MKHVVDYCVGYGEDPFAVGNENDYFNHGSHVADAVMLARLLAEDTEVTIIEQGKKNADCNRNGQPDHQDVVLILQTIARHFGTLIHFSLRIINRLRFSDFKKSRRPVQKCRTACLYHTVLRTVQNDFYQHFYINQCNHSVVVEIGFHNCKALDLLL